MKRLTKKNAVVGARVIRADGRTGNITMVEDWDTMYPVCVEICGVSFWYTICGKFAGKEENAELDIFLYEPLLQFGEFTVSESDVSGVFNIVNDGKVIRSFPEESTLYEVINYIKNEK